ncbi:MAG: hypothetical protein ACREQ4_07600 [Candidatus Binataceae bacterium]
MVVWLLGTPLKSEGSVNDPREREEYGICFNEKWLYQDLADDPAKTPMRIVYWHRYDFVGTVIRSRENEPWRVDHELERVLAADELRLYHNDWRAPEALRLTLKERDRRLYWLDGPSNAPLTPTNRYRPVSQVAGPNDLGGYVQGLEEEDYFYRPSEKKVRRERRGVFARLMAATSRIIKR